jgi:hypothetical protein
MKRYNAGGQTDYAESGSAGGSNVSFGEAFRAARKQGLKTFTWRGKEYTTDTKEDKAKKAEKSLSDVEVTSKRPDFSEFYKADKVTDKSGAGSRGASTRRRGKNLSEKIDERVGASIRGSSDSAEQKSRFEDIIQQRRARETMNYRKGGSVGSASKRADGCAIKGKTRGKFV